MLYGFLLSNILGSITIHDDKSYEKKPVEKDDVERMLITVHMGH